MNHPLDGARLKVIRAQEHLDALKAELNMFREEHPHEVVSKKNSDGTWEHTIRLTSAPPLRFSSLVGDCITNARAALDYIIWPIASKHLTAFSADADKWVNFPIATSAPISGKQSRYERTINRLANRQFPATALALIKSVQHHIGGDQYDPLVWLSRLVNTDKHRMPLLVSSVFGTVSVEFGRATDINFGMMSSANGATGFILNGANIPTDGFTFTSREMDMKRQITVLIAFSDVTMPPEPVDRTLEQIIETVRDIIPRFDNPAFF